MGFVVKVVKILKKTLLLSAVGDPRRRGVRDSGQSDAARRARLHRCHRGATTRNLTPHHHHSFPLRFYQSRTLGIQPRVG